jgi:rhodanese-related sulfurtransferase
MKKPAFLISAIFIVAAASISPATPVYAADIPAIKAMEDFLDFSEYGGGTILPEQIPAEDWKNIHVIDTRDAAQYQASHIPGAVNIEWRQVLARRAEIPRDKMVLVYCNTGTLSAQAGFALRVAGMDNVRILQGGYNEWKTKGGFEANKLAIRKSGKQGN